MRVLRIRLRDYRGIDNLEIRFPADGVTVIQGPNEVGKTSLAEAMDLLFEHLDTTTKQEVRATKPVDRDTGTEIEADVETGLYKFTYFKRFHKDRATELRIERPRPENLTGREAHERARQILQETMDVHLWRALRVQQGMGLDQPSLVDQTSLSAALDRAAGGSLGGAQEESLFEAVVAEYSRYHTETGREKADLIEADRVLQEANSAVTGLQGELGKLEADIERSSQLKREIAALEKSAAELEGTARERESRLEAVTRLKNAVAARKSVRDGAAAKRTTSELEKKERERLIKAVEDAAKKLATLIRQREAERPALDEARQDFERAEDELRTARREEKDASSLRKIRQEDYEYRREELDLRLLQERKSRIDKALKDGSAADALLARIRVTDKILEQIQRASIAVERARAKRETASPSVKIAAFGDIVYKLDGKRIRLSRGETHDQAVVESLRLTLPDVADLTITAGTSTASLSASLAREEEALNELCSKAGVADLREAQRANNDRSEAERIRTARNQILKENLRDLTLEQMEQKILDLGQRVGAYRKDRADKPAIASNLETAKVTFEQAKEAAQKAERKSDIGTRKHEAARERNDRLRSSEQETTLRVKLAEEALAADEEALKLARLKVSDEKLAEQVVKSSEKLQELEAEVRESEEKLEAEDPERAETLAKNARAAVTKENDGLRKAQDELIAVEARLKDRGEEGLSERLDIELARFRRAEYQREGLRRRAAAAKLLYSTMRSAREEARQAYLAPLRTRIEKLGRYVFGNTFAVEMDESLEVVSRTVEGRTIPFRDLSGGTKEQIAVIVRLACAMTVAEDGGVPVVLDDALGYSDPKRLEEMSAVLSLAGRHCQLIVLTCVPDRYRHVGDAHVVKIG